jgi:hypothetical protein
MNRASARSSLSIEPNCSASTRQAFFSTSNRRQVGRRNCPSGLSQNGA